MNSKTTSAVASRPSDGTLLYRLYYCQLQTGRPEARQTLQRAQEALEAQLGEAPDLEVPFYLANVYRNSARLTEARRVAFSQGERQLSVLTLEVLETCPYTSTIDVRQEHSLSWLPVAQMEVRVYHDARMAEVIGAQSARRFRGISSRSPRSWGRSATRRRSTATTTTTPTT